MNLKPIKIHSDDTLHKRCQKPPPEEGRSLGAFFNDVMSDVTENMRQSARRQITKVMQDVDDMKPDTAKVDAYARYRDLTGHLSALRDDIVNGGWKGAAAARQVLAQFKGYADRPPEERYNMLPRLQMLIP